MSNVAFGGSWSEELLQQHQTAVWLETLQWAVDHCKDQAVDTDDVRVALEQLTKDLEKGVMLFARFNKGHGIVNQNRRQEHFRESLTLIENWLGT